MRCNYYDSKASEINAVSEIMDQKSLIDSVADKVVEKLKVKICSINFEPPDNDLCSACHA